MTKKPNKLQTLNPDDLSAEEPITLGGWYSLGDHLHGRYHWGRGGPRLSEVEWYCVSCGERVGGCHLIYGTEVIARELLCERCCLSTRSESHE